MSTRYCGGWRGRPETALDSLLEALPGRVLCVVTDCHGATVTVLQGGKKKILAVEVLYADHRGEYLAIVEG